MTNRQSILHTLLICALLTTGCTEFTAGSAPPPASASVISNAEAANPATPDAITGLGLAELKADVEALIDGLRTNSEGKIYSAAVDGTRPDDLAIAVALADGRSLVAGDGGARFPLMSTSKPFTYALAVEQHGPDFMLKQVGVSATGLPYNSVAAGAVRPTSEQNPLVNAGAIATISYIDGETPADKTAAVVDLYSRMANRPLAIEPDWQATPRALTYTLAYQMKAAGRLAGDVENAAASYLNSNIVAADVEALAQMGATLANGGIQPLTGERILSTDTVRTVLSAMIVAGMYQDSGRWWTEIGLPAKSGVSGAIVAVVPGWGSIAVYSPRLDPAGNSVRGTLAIRELAERWGLHSIDRLLATRPAPVISTFSIVAYDPETGDYGIAVQSKYFAVGDVVPHAAAGTGAIATQARGNLLYGPDGLTLLNQGMSAADVIESLTSADPLRAERQVGIVDRDGTAASFTGEDCLPWAGGLTGRDYAVQGNLLAGPQVVQAMASAFEAASGDLARRLVYALAAGQAAGGDARGRQSAAVLVVRQNGGYLGLTDRYIDLHVEDHAAPIRELKRLLQIRYAQLEVTAANELLSGLGDTKPSERAGVLQQATSHVQEALRLHPADDHAWWQLAHIQLLAGNQAAAAEAGRRALLENPSWRHLSPDTLRSLGVEPELIASLLNIDSFRDLWNSLAATDEPVP